MIGAAVNIMEVPAQIVVLAVLIETLGVLEVFTVIVMILLVMLFAETHPALLVNTQVITSLLARVLLL